MRGWKRGAVASEKASESPLKARKRGSRSVWLVYERHCRNRFETRVLLHIVSLPFILSLSFSSSPLALQPFIEISRTYARIHALPWTWPLLCFEAWEFILLTVSLILFLAVRFNRAVLSIRNCFAAFIFRIYFTTRDNAVVFANISTNRVVLNIST